MEMVRHKQRRLGFITFFNATKLPPFPRIRVAEFVNFIVALEKTIAIFR